MYMKPMESGGKACNISLDYHWFIWMGLEKSDDTLNSTGALKDGNSFSSSILLLC